VVDLTLREGEEYPDAVLSVDAKLMLAERLVARGFRQLEVGYAGVIEEHAELVRALKRRFPDVTVVSHARAYAREGEWQQEIERSAEAGCDLLTFVLSVSELGLAATPWLAKADVPARVAACVAAAKAQGLAAAFGLTDPIRTRRDDLTACYAAAASAGAERLYVYDGVGGATPEAFAGLVRAVRSAAGRAVIIGVHCHNTLGLATANALAAVGAGATVVDATPLGLGDGGGITATEELVVALKVLYDIDTGIALHDLRPLCEEIAAAFGVQVPGHKAVIGRNIYRHQIDAHIAAIVRGHWYTWELIHPDALGQTRRIEFASGKIRPGRSGALGAMVERRGQEVTDAQLATIADAVRARAATQKILTDSDVEEIIGRVIDAH
jgi:isopropylmalate/homocitrate/citramalate synthase